MDNDHDMHGGRSAGQGHDAAAGTAVDPVCGMTVDPNAARDRGLYVRHDGTDYFFCGRGCKLDFEENPAQFLAPDYQPHM